MTDDAGATWKLVNDNRNIRQRAFYYTHVYADPKQQGHGLHAEHVAVPLDRRRQDADERRRAARTATTTTCGSIPTIRQHLVNGNDGGGAVSSNTGADVDATRTSRRRSSIT